MIVVSGSASNHLGFLVAKELSCKQLTTEVRMFPDGERYIRFAERIDGEDVVVIQSLYKNPDSLITEYGFMVRTLLEFGARRILGVFPYLAYLRQDQRFKDGEVVSSKVVSWMIERFDTSEVFVVDPHLHRLAGLKELFNIPAHNISAMPNLAHYAKEVLNATNPIIVAPDEEASQWAYKVASELNAEFKVAEKKRMGDNDVIIHLGDISPAGKDILLVDDMVSTGGTLATISKDLKLLGARRIIALVTHGLFAEGSYERLQDAGVDYIVTSDSVPNPYALVTVAPLIADAIRQEL
ncbi:MAG: ribose-phosphate diphosphokinase [Candidatus Parvarchaeota archaeon]